MVMWTSFGASSDLRVQDQDQLWSSFLLPGSLRLPALLCLWQGVSVLWCP